MTRGVAPRMPGQVSRNGARRQPVKYGSDPEGQYGYRQGACQSDARGRATGFEHCSLDVTRAAQLCIQGIAKCRCASAITDESHQRWPYA